MSQELRDFIALLDRDELRGSRPADFIFLCGGFANDTSKPPFYSLRHYLLQHKSFTKWLSAYLVLAEDAQNIFNDRYYDDLISFEEDIARAATLIGVIAESPGSLAELGAFASIPNIAQTTCTIQQREFEAARSFITLGPIKRLVNDYPGSVAYFPWKKNKSKVFHTTCRPHVRAIATFLNERLALAEDSFRLRSDPELELMFIVLWVVFLYKEVSTQTLYDTVKIIMPAATETQIKAKIYSLLVSKWIGEEPYSGKKYYYYRFEEDPLIYRFLNPGHRVDDYKVDVVTSLRANEKIPRHVVRVGRKARVVTAS